MKLLKMIGILIGISVLQLGCYTTFGPAVKSDTVDEWYSGDTDQGDYEVVEYTGPDSVVYEDSARSGVANYYFNNNVYVQDPVFDDFSPDWSLSMSFISYPDYWDPWYAGTSWRWRYRPWNVWDPWDYYDPYLAYPVLVYPWYPPYISYSVYWDDGGYVIHNKPGKKRDWDKRTPGRTGERRPVDRSGTTLVGGTNGGGAAGGTTVSRTGDKKDKPVRLRPRTTIDRTKIDRTKQKKRKTRTVIRKRTSTRKTKVIRTKSSTPRKSTKTVKRTRKSTSGHVPSYGTKKSGSSSRGKSSTTRVNRSSNSSSSSKSSSRSRSGRSGRSTSKRR